MNKRGLAIRDVLPNASNRESLRNLKNLSKKKCFQKNC